MIENFMQNAKIEYIFFIFRLGIFRISVPIESCAPGYFSQRLPPYDAPLFGALGGPAFIRLALCLDSHSGIWRAAAVSLNFLPQN